MAAMLGADLHAIIYKGGRLQRYLFCARKTIGLLIREKPDVVFAPNPSIVLNYLLLTLRLLFRYQFVTDAHFGGVVAYNGNRFFQKALDLCNRWADLVIVTNRNHMEHIGSVGGKAVICEDPLPDLAGYNASNSSSGKIVFFICSFDIDEPFNLVFEAAKKLSIENFNVRVTGNYNKVGIVPADFPAVQFLGFLPEDDYYKQLFQSDIVIDLTGHENCLVCGAYEAMVAEKPLITSDTISLREYFYQGTVFTRHDSASIVEAVKTAYANRDQLTKEIREWKEQVKKKQADRQLTLQTLLDLN
jgi:glycosyltransferase involved in cell wall biosynthesis